MKDLELIWQVKCSPELYDAQHSNFQNHELREYTWDEIADRLYTSPGECKQRWSQIEHNFREMIIARRNGIDHKDAPYSRELCFLVPFIHAEEDLLGGSTSSGAGKKQNKPRTETNAPSDSSPDPLIDFFLSMGKTVKQFDKKKQLDIKDKVYQLVRNAELEMVENKTARMGLRK